MDVISTSDLSATSSSTGLMGWFSALLARLFASSAPSSSSPIIPTSPADEFDAPGTYIVAPGGYHIRVPNPSDVGHNVGVELPHVREALASVPPLPHVVMELLKEVQNPISTAASVATIASSDPALAAVLLRTVNSAAFGLTRKISSVSDAVNYLGFAMVRSIVVRLRLDQVLPRKDARTNNDAEDIWVHSLAVSYIADTLAARVTGVDRGLASTLGLLHDLGKLAIVARLGSIEGRPGDSASAAEARAYGLDHAGLGANLAHAWALPADLVQAIRFHHHPEMAFEETDPPALRKAVYLVQIANELAKYGFAYTDKMELDPQADLACQKLGLGNSAAALLDAKAQQAITKAILFTADDHAGAPRVRRFLRIHSGPEAARLAQKDTALPAQIIFNDAKACTDFSSDSPVIKLEPKRAHQLDRHDLTEPTKIFQACATADGMETLADACNQHQSEAQLAPTTQSFFNFTLRSLLANFALANDAQTTVEVAQSITPHQSAFTVRSALLATASRLGKPDQRQAHCLIASELANLINLNWFATIYITADGATWRFLTHA